MESARSFKCNRRKSTCRSAGISILKHIIGDRKSAVKVFAFPIWKSGSVYLERKGVFNLINHVGTKMSQAANDDRLVFISGPHSPIIRGKFGKVARDKDKRISTIGVEHQHPLA